MKKFVLLTVVVMMLFCSLGPVYAANQTPYTEQRAQSDYLCGATFTLEQPEQYEQWITRELTQARNEYRLNTITVYGLENFDDAYKAALFTQLKALNMQICVRIEGYDSDFAFTQQDAQKVMERYEGLVAFTSQPEYRDTVRYYAINMPVDDPAVQANLGGVNSELCKANQVTYAQQIVRLMRQYTAKNGNADAKLYLSVFYGWDGTYDVPSYASAGADGYFINNYTYPAGDLLAGAGDSPDHILNTPRLREIMKLFLEDYPHKPPLVVESGFHTLEYNNGQWPAQTAGLVLDRETKAVAMKELVAFYEREYPFVEGLLYFGYNLFKEEGNPPAVMDWAMKYPTEDKSAGTCIPGQTGINLMDNAGFEHMVDAFPCWGHNSAVTPNTDPAYTHSGAVSAKVATGHQADAYAYCNLSATYDLNADFTAGMWVYLTSASDARYVTVYLERPDSAGGTLSAKPESKAGWQKVTLRGTATKGTARQAIKFVVAEGHRNPIYFDDAFVYCHDAESINLIRNSGFNGNKNTWEDDTTFTLSTDVIHSGSGSAQLVGKQDIYQASGWWPNKSSVDSGEMLYYSAWVKGGENAGSISLRAEVKCGVTKNYYSAAVTGQTDNWQLLTVQIPYPDLTVTEILFHISTTGNGVFYADDVAVNAVDPTPKAVWQGHSMALGDDLDMRFHVAVCADAEDAISLQVNVAGKEKTYGLADSVKDEATGHHIFSVSLAAAQMTEPVSVKLMADGKAVHTGSYTVKDYAESLLAQTQNESLTALLQAMLVYGGKAQTYFAYRVEDMADANLKLAPLPIPDARNFDCKIQNGLDNIWVYGATLVLRSRTAIRYYFTVNDRFNPADCTVCADGKEVQLHPDGEMYYVELTVANPAVLDTEHTVTISMAEGTLSVSYSGIHYVARMWANAESPLKELVQALYGYHMAAKRNQI